MQKRRRFIRHKASLFTTCRVILRPCCSACWSFGFRGSTLLLAEVFAHPQMDRTQADEFNSKTNNSWILASISFVFAALWQIRREVCWCCRPSKTYSKHLLNVEPPDYDDLADVSVRSERTEPSMTQVRSTVACSGIHGMPLPYEYVSNGLIFRQSCSREVCHCLGNVLWLA